jgi:hypothetical protein
MKGGPLEVQIFATILSLALLTRTQTSEILLSMNVRHPQNETRYCVNVTISPRLFSAQHHLSTSSQCVLLVFHQLSCQRRQLDYRLVGKAKSLPQLEHSIHNPL